MVDVAPVSPEEMKMRRCVDVVISEKVEKRGVLQATAPVMVKNQFIGGAGMFAFFHVFFMNCQAFLATLHLKNTCFNDSILRQCGQW